MASAICLSGIGALAPVAASERTAGAEPADLAVQALTVTSAERDDGIQQAQVAVGQALAIRCRWSFRAPQPPGQGATAYAGVPGFRWSVDNAITVNREPIGRFRELVSASNASGEHGPLHWRAPGPGRYRIRCALDEAGVLGESEARRRNNVAEFTVAATEAVRGL